MHCGKLAEPLGWHLAAAGELTVCQAPGPLAHRAGAVTWHRTFPGHRDDEDEGIPGASACCAPRQERQVFGKACPAELLAPLTLSRLRATRSGAGQAVPKGPKQLSCHVPSGLNVLWAQWPYKASGAPLPFWSLSSDPSGSCGCSLCPILVKSCSLYL